jgi:hypothetical protein
MSEFQRIAFRAIDGPVSEKNLHFMRQQSTRAEITPWTFDNEYQWGDFHGNAPEMLRRGYDVYFHYANFGTRTLMIRLPRGLPDAETARPYLGNELVQLIPDKQGPGAILSIDPYYEAGELEEIWDFDELLGRLMSLRAEILDGDLRPLYLAHLAAACDNNHDPDGETEAPVPAGLKKLTDAQRALAEFYHLGDSLLAAAAEASPPLPSTTDSSANHAEWLRTQPAERKDAWLSALMADPRSPVRREMLAEFQKARNAPAWSAARTGRTITALRARAEEFHAESDRKTKEKSERDRSRRLAQMAADPAPTVRETEALVGQRGARAYEQVASLLADLRDALAGGSQSGLADEQARKLRDNHPTLRTLVSQLRRKGFLPKEGKGAR